MRLASLGRHAAPVQIHSSGGVSSPVGKAWLDVSLHELKAKSEGTVTDDALASTSDFILSAFMRKYLWCDLVEVNFIPFYSVIDDGFVFVIMLQKLFSTKKAVIPTSSNAEPILAIWELIVLNLFLSLEVRTLGLHRLIRPWSPTFSVVETYSSPFLDLRAPDAILISPCLSA